MSDRDELIELIDGLQDVGRSRAFMIADAILAAGEWTPFKACEHPDRHDLKGEDGECIACDIERGPAPVQRVKVKNGRISFIDKDGNTVTQELP